jgi:hypothetical protein
MTEPRIDGHEAYRDDPEYTAPEMQPGHGEDIHPESDPAEVVGSSAALGIGVAGVAFAGEVLTEEAEEEHEAFHPRPEPPDELT